MASELVATGWVLLQAGSLVARLPYYAALAYTTAVIGLGTASLLPIASAELVAR